VQTSPPSFPPPVDAPEIDVADVILARSHMRAFMRVVAPKYVDMWGCALTCDWLTQIARTVRGLGDDPEAGPSIDALFLEGPPQHWKSFLTGQYFPAFLACQWQDVRMLNVCHSRDLSQRAVRDFCQVLDRPQVREISRLRYGRVTDGHGESIREESASRRVRFIKEQGGALVKTGGYYLSSSIGGGSTGWAANLVDLDDLVPDPEAAESPGQRAALEKNVRSVALTRLQDDKAAGGGGGAIVMSMTPWYKGDIGHTMQRWCEDAGMRTKVLRLPAVAEPGIDLDPDDPRTPGSGEILDPYRHSSKFYRRQRVLQGDYFWRTMWQAQRGTANNELVNPACWHYFDPLMLKLKTAVPVSFVLGIDPNGKEGGPCYAHLSLWACVRVGRRVQAWKMLQVRGSWSYDVLTLTTAQLLHTWPIEWLLIEQNNYGTALVSQYQNKTPVLGPDGKAVRPMRQVRVVPVNPRQEKFTRAKKVRPLAEVGLLRLPESSLGDVVTDWVPVHTSGWETFPGKNLGDLDMIDCDAMCVSFLEEKYHLLREYCNSEGIPIPQGLG
jgi:hypothetical protein